MKIGISAVVKPVFDDLKKVRKISKTASIQAMNRISATHVETPAVASVSEKKQVAKGVIRWHHDIHGQRTRRRRLIKMKANKNQDWVGWRWGTKSGEPGKVSVISLPGRTQTKKGVKAGRSGPLIPSAFIRTTKKGQLGAFTRLTRRRYPIKFLRIDMTGTADSAFNNRVKTSGKPFQEEYNRLMTVKLKRTASRARRSTRRAIGRATGKAIAGALR